MLKYIDLRKLSLGYDDETGRVSIMVDGVAVPLSVKLLGEIVADIINADMTALIDPLADILEEIQVLTSAPVEKTPVKIVRELVASGKDYLCVTSTPARAFYLQAKLATGANLNNIFIGLSDVASGTAELFELAPGETFEYVAPAGTMIDLHDVFIASSALSNGVVGWYVPI